MAVTVLTGCSVLVNSVNLSDHVRELEIDDGVVELSNTAMTHTAESTQAGLKRPSMTLKFLQDYANGKTNETLRPLVGTTTAVVIRLTTAIRSGTNPEWAFTGFLSSWKPISGAVGVLQEPVAVFKSAGTPFTYLTTAT